MPLRDLPPVYPLDPELRDASARFTDHVQEYIEQALGWCHENASRDDVNDALAVGSQMLAIQLNVLAHELENAVKQIAPQSAKGMTHADWVQRMMADVCRRALQLHLERDRAA